MFHLKLKPSPPWSTGRLTPGQAVDSSAIVSVPGCSSLDAAVGGAQEVDGVEVLVAAIAVGYPLARLAAVVEIEHGGDGIDAQRVDVELVEPIECARLQEVGDLGAPEIIDQRVPVVVEAEPRILVLVERGSVEADQPVRVGGKVRRNPVQDDADAGNVQPV